MERTINDIVRESEEQGSDSQWTPEDEGEDVTVCECCGSENVRTAGDGNMGFCEDCDAPCSTIEVKRCDNCDNTGIITRGWGRGWFCSCEMGKRREAE